MAEIIRMPKMSDTMEEGVIASWLKKVGDEIKSGDILAEVETDKATMELESYDDGTLLHIGIKDGESVPVNGIIAIIGEKNEDISEILNEANKNPSDEEDKKELIVEEEKDIKGVKKTKISTDYNVMYRLVIIIFMMLCILSGMIFIILIIPKIIFVYKDVQKLREDIKMYENR